MAQIALFIPCFNEAKRLDVSAFQDFILSQTGFIDFYFVNDGSRDNTSEIISEKLLFPGSSFLISTKKNLGKGNALVFSFSKVDLEKYDYVAFIDSDGDIPLNQVLKLHEMIKQENAHFAISNREFIQNFKIFDLRSYVSLLMVWLANSLIGYKELIKDTQCGCKMFRSELVKHCFGEYFISDWLFDIEMFIRFRQQFVNSRERIKEVPLVGNSQALKSRSKLLSSHKIIYHLYQIRRNYR